MKWIDSWDNGMETDGELGYKDAVKLKKCMEEDAEYGGRWEMDDINQARRRQANAGRKGNMVSLLQGSSGIVDDDYHSPW
jgi:hypothetical protein